MSKQDWINSLKIGDIVCDCRYSHRKIISFSISGSNDKNLDLEGGFSCSARHCCSIVDHPKHWRVYILKCSDKSLYTGITNDLERRLKQHNSGNKGAKYTRTRRPVELYKAFEADNKSQALKLERKIKRLPKQQKLNLDIDQVAQMKKDIK